MPDKLYFPIDEVLRIGLLTAAAAEHTDSFVDADAGRKTGPALMWVKDHGTYLMSNAVPRPADDVIYARDGSPTGPLLTGDGPGDWERCRDICGGDDFAEYVPLAELLDPLGADARAGAKWLVLRVGSTDVGLGVSA